MQNDQQHLIEPPSQYERLQAKGMMEWYNKAKRVRRINSAAPLDDEQCGSSSIYIRLKDGSLWTLSVGKPYKQVRPPSIEKQSLGDQFECVHCHARSSEERGIIHNCTAKCCTK